jgi:UDP-N-acetylmuramoyl-tripeptide--D-alanyl-D-alanine ligase
MPTLAVVNNVMFAHAGHFASLAEIASAKGEIYDGLTKNGVACVDLSNQFSNEYLESLAQRQIKVFEYGVPKSNCYIKEFTLHGAKIVTPLGEFELRLQILGRHNYLNALTVVALALNLGCNLAEIKVGLEKYTGYKGRLERKTAFNGALIVDDTYNANPDSVLAALLAVQNLNKPLWFVFGDLKELGVQELEFHRKIAEAADSGGVECLLTIGDLAKHGAEFFGGEKIHFESNQDIVKYCLLHLPTSATLLIKGSNSMHLAEVATQLSKVS